MQRVTSLLASGYLINVSFQKQHKLLRNTVK